MNHNDVLELLSTNTCSFCNLSYADLAYSSLPRADMSGSKLSNAILVNSILTNANLSDADLSNANLSGSDLKYVDFTGAILRGTDFTNANLTGSSISRSQLVRSRWQRALGIDTSILLDTDIMELINIHLRANQLMAANNYLSSMLSRSNDDASLYLLRASINFKSGYINSAIHDLQMAIDIYERSGDVKSAHAVNEVLFSYDINSEVTSKSYGPGYGIEMLDAIKSIVPILVPLTSKFLLPLSLL